MSVKRYMMYLFGMPLLLLVALPFSTLAAADMEELLPPVSCTEGWNIEGKPLFYNRETLSDRINGEAELYFPYGFDQMAAARYSSVKNSGSGMDVEIYRMGSLLDAFGMYANYRQKEGRSLTVGAESNLSGSQLYFYRGRNFVHIQITGTDDSNSASLAECAKTVASRIPGNNNRPPELSVFDRPEVIKGTERYLPQNLLGYDFLNRGIMTDAVVEGTNFQIFLLLGTTAKSALTVLDRYRSQLTQGRVDASGKDTVSLEGIDPLYGPVIVLKNRDCLAGALKFSGKKGIRELLESVCR